MTSSKPFLAVLNHVLEFQARVGTLDFGDPMTLQTWNQNLIRILMLLIKSYFMKNID